MNKAETAPNMPPDFPSGHTAYLQRNLALGQRGREETAKELRGDVLSGDQGEVPARPMKTEPIKITSSHAKKIFEYLVKAYAEDYMRKKYAQESSGWRSLVTAADGAGLSRGLMYGSRGGFSPLVNGLLRQGLVETRIFPGERGRGGQVSKLRISYGRKPVQEVVDRMIWGKVRGLEVAQALDKKRVAVLPFASMSPDPNDEYFADGMTEEVISTLSKVKGMQVISRTSVMGYKRTTKPIGEICRELDVGTILEGSVRKAGIEVRVTVQIIDGVDDAHLWTESYDRQLRDVFQIQVEIAKRVADALKVRILPAERARIEKTPTTNPAAHTLYLKGRHHWNERSKQGLLKAVEYFKQAIELDPEYALAYSGVADCYGVLGNNWDVPYEEAFSIGKENALKAVHLDESSGEAHVSLAMILGAYYDWEGAETEFKKAIELDPNYATGHHWYSLFLSKMGNIDGALREISLAQRLDPLSPIIALSHGDAYFDLEKYDLAEEQYREALRINPNFIHGHSMLSWVFLAEGRFDEAEKEVNEYLRITKGDPRGRGYLAAVYAYAGKKEEAMRILDEVNRIDGGTRVINDTIISIYLRLGENEKAIELIQKEFEAHANWLPTLAFVSRYSGVRSDPRIVEILRKIGLGKHGSQRR